MNDAGYGGYIIDADIIKGSFSYPSVISSTQDLFSVFYYSDSLFAGPANHYDPHLATMSMNLSMAAFATNANNDTGDYSNKFAHVKQMLSDIGCDDSRTYVSGTFTVKPGADTIGLTISQKRIHVNDDDFVLVPIAIRGFGYESEWSSNFTVGDGLDPVSGEQAGFSSAADQVCDQLETYVRNDASLLEALRAGKVKFWVVGYSRAGATANMVSKRLVDSLRFGDGPIGPMADNDVYCYSFEAPQGGVASAEKGGPDAYDCIHTVINTADMVPLMAMGQMGFKRYGVDHYVPGGEAGPVRGAPFADDNNRCDNESVAVDQTDDSAYQRQLSLMLCQLTAINRYLTFNDSYCPATINYVEGALGFTDMITEVDADSIVDEQADDITLLEGFVRGFLRELQLWTFGSDKGLYRHIYATSLNTLAGSDESFQTAFQHVTALVFSKSPDQLLGIRNAMSCVTGSVGTAEFVGLYWNVIRRWDELPETGKVKYLDKIWSYLMEPNGSAPCVGDYLSPGERKTLSKDWPVLGDFIFRLISGDFNHEVAFARDGSSGIVKENQVYIATLAHNMATIAQNHRPEVGLAWLRSYDSLYADDVSAVDFDVSQIVVDAPKASIPEGPMTGTAPLELTCANAGGAIYYRVHTQVGRKGAWSAWALYQNPIALDGGTSHEVTLTVEAYAMAYGERSETASFVYGTGGSPRSRWGFSRRSVAGSPSPSVGSRRGPVAVLRSLRERLPRR